MAIPHVQGCVLPLEAEFREHYQDVSVDTEADVPFPDFLAPNETGVKRARPLYQLQEEGVLVSVGTERAFFGLCLAGHSAKCRGLVGRDINPRVKAYIDFNVLLLRIAESRKEYVAFSSLSVDKFDTLLPTVEERLNQAVIPDHMKRYYKNNLKKIGNVYYRTSRFWRNTKGYLHYHLEKRSFKILKSYAQAGNIISTIGDISDLFFLQHRPISLIDVSNIPDYFFIDLNKGKEDFCPRVIWTKCIPGLITQYQSYLHESITEEERVEIAECIATIKSSFVEEGEYPERRVMYRILQANCAQEDCTEHSLASPLRFSSSTLKLLKRYRTMYLLEGNFGVLDFFNSYAWKTAELRLNKFDTSTLQQVGSVPGINRFTAKLVQFWNVLDPEKFCAFSTVEGWKEAFEKERSICDRINYHFRIRYPDIKKCLDKKINESPLKFA